MFVFLLKHKHIIPDPDLDRTWEAIKREASVGSSARLPVTQPPALSGQMADPDLAWLAIPVPGGQALPPLTPDPGQPAPSAPQAAGRAPLDQPMHGQHSKFSRLAG